MVEANPKAYRAYLLRSHFALSARDEAAADRDLESALALAPQESAVVLAVAERRIAQAKPAEAYALLEQGLRHNPLEPALYKAMADLKIRARDRAAAVQLLTHGLRKLPHNADLLTLQTDLLIDQGDLITAGRQVRELIRLVPQSYLPDYLQARIAIGKSQWPEAITLLQRCRKQMSPLSDWASRVYALLGVCFHQTGDREQELSAFRQAVQAEPHWGAARVGLGAALLENGRIDDAVNELQLVRIAADPPPELWPTLGRALLERNRRLPEAERDWSAVDVVLARAREVQPKAQELVVLQAEALAARGDFAKARQLLQKAQPTVLLRCAEADLVEQQGLPAEADRILAQAETDLGDCIELRLSRCRLWSRRSDVPQQELARLSSGLERFNDADRLRLLRELAETWNRLNEPARAEEVWRRIAVAAPQDVRSRFALVELMLRAQRLDETRRLLAELRKLEGAQGMQWRYGTAALRIAEARTDRGKLAEARKLLAELERQHPDWGRVPLLAARADELEGRLDSAARDYERAVERGEARPAVVMRLLELLLERQEYLRAEEALGRYMQQRPLSPELARLGAEVAVGNGNSELARARAERAVRLPSTDYRDHLWLARILHACGDDAEATQLLRTALAHADHVPDVWVALIEQLGRTGQSAEAAKVLAEARQKLPGVSRSLTLARAHEALHQLAEAEAQYEQAISGQPTDFITLGQAADFYLRQDRFDRAEPLLRHLLTPVVAAPAERTAWARRQLAVLVAPRNRAEALALLDGGSPADERVRLYVVGQDPAELPQVLKRFSESLEHRPATAAERLLLADLYLAADQASQARAVLQPLATARDPQPQHVARYAAALIRTGDLDGAAACVAQLERWEPQAARTRTLAEALRNAQQR
jgi:predicted Zn-dependent protease